MNIEGMLGFALDHYRLVDQYGVDQHCFQAGDVFEVHVGGEFQVVHMESGGYKGWYFVTAKGQRVRPALCMKARLADSWQEGHA